MMCYNRNYLEKESLKRRHTLCDSNGWKFYAKEGIPQQINGHDCGVFLASGVCVCVCVCVYNTCILTVVMRAVPGTRTRAARSPSRVANIKCMAS